MILQDSRSCNNTEWTYKQFYRIGRNLRGCNQLDNRILIRRQTTNRNCISEYDVKGKLR